MERNKNKNERFLVSHERQEDSEHQEEKKKPFQPIILWPEKIPFKNEGKIKFDSDIKMPKKNNQQ